MNIIFIDDEMWAINEFKKISTELNGIDKITLFSDIEETLNYVQKNKVDLVFLDIDMPKMNGIDLAKEILSINNNCIIIYVSAYEEFIPLAFREKADYFILKPFKKEDIEDSIIRAKLLLKRFEEENKKIKIQTFGFFEIFIDNKPVFFSSKKAKELLALLVDYNGKIVDSQTAFNCIWEDKYYNNVNSSLYRHTLHRLEKTLKEYGLTDLIIRYPRGRAINTEIVDCDYFNLLKSKNADSFNGKYMSEYAWGEETLGTLTFLVDKMYNEKTGCDTIGANL